MRPILFTFLLVSVPSVLWADDCAQLIQKSLHGALHAEAEPVLHVASSPRVLAVAGVALSDGSVQWVEALPPYESVAIARSPSGKIKTVYSKANDVDVVFNPYKNKFESRKTDPGQNAVIGVLNPSKKRVEWFYASGSDVAVAAAFNPSSGEVESETLRADQGKQLAAYYNPDSKSVEFAVPDYGYSTVSPYYDYVHQKVKIPQSKITMGPQAVVIPGLDTNLYSAHKVKVSRKVYRPRARVNAPADADLDLQDPD